MSGIQEFALIAAIIGAIFFLPRMLRGPKIRSQSRLPKAGRSFQLSGWQRLAIVASLAWPLVTGIYYQLWSSGNWMVWLYAGGGPVLLFWGLVWVAGGFRKKRRR